MPTLERETELDAIAAALDAAADGRACTVVIEGPAGIGKTRLITVDDAQSAETPSLRFLAPHVGDLPIALIIATRLPAERPGALAEVDAARHGAQLSPQPPPRSLQPRHRQGLFVTRKTVENHLGRVYVKLGIRGRRELATALLA